EMTLSRFGAFGFHMSFPYWAGLEREKWRAETFASARMIRFLGVLEPFGPQDRTKSAMTAGAVVSKPTTSSMPRSFGSAIVKPLEVMPTTTAFASPTNSLRYWRRACAGWMLPAHVSLSV